MKIARVFPRRIPNATPRDGLAFTAEPGLFPPKVDEVHISLTFTWDRPRAEYLAAAWSKVAPVKIGGPALGNASGVFVPGRYLQPGYTITSRGCPNHCWFCKVWRREGPVRELPIEEGWNILDDNLLACSERHILEVIEMLRRQKKHRPRFTGGLEAARMSPAIAEALRSIKPESVFMAYDTPDDYPHLVRASHLLWHAGFPRRKHCVQAYVLIGYPADSFSQALDRLTAVAGLGILPFAMLWRDESGKVDPAWAKFQRVWCRPVTIMRELKKD